MKEPFDINVLSVLTTGSLPGLIYSVIESLPRVTFEGKYYHVAVTLFDSAAHFALIDKLYQTLILVMFH